MVDALPKANGILYEVPNHDLLSPLSPELIAQYFFHI
jgi:hypothetical protein